MPDPYSDRVPHPVDQYVGSRLRLRRTYLGYSQEKLAQSLGLTFQQIQKYERGANRVSASKLYELSRLLDVSVTFFFEGVESVLPEETFGHLGHARKDSQSGDVLAQTPDFMTKKETVNLVSAYYRIKDENVRKEVLSLLNTLGGMG